MVLRLSAKNFRQKTGFSRRFRKIMLFSAMLVSAFSQNTGRIQAQPVPQSKPSLQKEASKQLIEAQSLPEQNLHQEWKLGEIKEESPPLPLPQPQNSTLSLPQLLMPAHSQPTPSTATIIGTYPLNEALLTKLEKIHAEILKLPEADDDDDSDDDIRGGIDVLVKAMEKRPDIISILGRNLMTARDYVTAMQAVSNALAHASGAGEVQIFGENSKISSENLAFGKKYANRIRNLLEE